MQQKSGGGEGIRMRELEKFQFIVAISYFRIKNKGSKLN
jgi:hypothetical protein